MGFWGPPMDQEPDLCDEPPEEWVECPVCNGSGEEVFGYWGYEPGCGHGHMMDDGRPCSRCGGDGGWIADREPDRVLP